ncbi:KpsF/GutQ family sugar-phosphate isomerase [uncultured Litoreibacter sp.]|uniref:KpsF/GutQ family sugar-phosphate isomerase n=1 Tax=uncultured Litoreibacter sp. TaxID=1392394 RepID=UPI0026368B59|nr:KpsF/GutQ family sugar-phosphate isomerase [uncultured Litoreibacter sp.]
MLKHVTTKTQMDTPIQSARRVITDEAEALTKLAQSIDGSFAEAVDRIQTCQGRVIVTGMGKSGHIANKIAATLASTGTPAHFVHPAEASHGDLGMIGKTDVVLALSNSGEAPELSNLLAYTRRFNIPLIAITSRIDGTLATQSDICLLIPQLGEACGYGVVPTISTTMTLAMGDALAITLMQLRGFTPEHFRDFHPGGKLGAKLSKVGDLMHSGSALPMVSLDTPMSEALLEISQKGFGVVAVTDADGHLAGIITDGDLRRHMDGLLDQTAETVMTAAPQTITPDSLADAAVSIMNDRKITCLFVTENGTATAPMGLLHIHDCLRAGVA